MKSVQAIVVVAVCFIALDGCQRHQGFGVYVIKTDIDLRLIDVQRDSIATEWSPLFIMDDILSYSKEDHEIRLKHKAFENFSRRAKVSRRGIPFAVCANGRPRYLGILLSGVSQNPAPYVVAYPRFGKTDTIEITAGYLTEDGNDENEPTVLGIFDLLEKEWKRRAERPNRVLKK